MNCSKCVFFKETESEVSAMPVATMGYIPPMPDMTPSVADIKGDCRNKAPATEGFPKVASTDWCGSFIGNR